MGFKDYLTQVVQLTRDKIRDKKSLPQEYEELEQVGPAPGDSWEQHPTMVAQGLCKKACDNERKNRYCNLFPFDSNLVHFDDEPDFYVNASWVNVTPEDKEKKFMITMAPMHPKSYGGKSDFNEDTPSNTCPDFWKMIWKTDTKLIVMLCEIGAGFTGCSQYYPSEEGKVAKHKPFLVKNVSTKKSPFHVERDFEITAIQDKTKKTVKHLQFLKWPNYGVPEEVAEIADFVKIVYEKREELGAKSPEYVVHCSGGVGRSGTFIAAYETYSKFLALAKEIEKTGVDPKDVEAVNLVPIVKQLREQRHPWAVEGLRQYVMAYHITIYLLGQMSGPFYDLGYDNTHDDFDEDNLHFLKKFLP